mgnify:CR=1 FL=1
MLNLTHWRGSLIRKRYLWCLRWCAFLTISLGSVALSAWVMLASLIQDLPNQSAKLEVLRQTNDQLAADLMADRELVNALTESIDGQGQQVAQLSSRLMRLDQLSVVGSLRLISVVDESAKTTVRIQLGDLSQLDQMVTHSAFMVRSVDPGVHAVVAELELSDE